MVLIELYFNSILIRPADLAWRLLQHYLDYFSGAESGTFHACVANKLLSLNCPLPYWLSLSLKVNINEIGIFPIGNIICNNFYL